MTVKYTGNNFKKLVVELKRLKDAQITIGVQGDEAKEPYPDEPTTNLQVAIWNEYGTENEDGSQRIPSRPFLSSTFGKNRPRYKQALKVVMKQVSDGKVTTDKALNRLGLLVQSDIQKGISSGIEPANAASTIARKGSSKPLIDTGQLRASVTYKIETK